jgi:hypothetical protein
MNWNILFKSACLVIAIYCPYILFLNNLFKGSVHFYSLNISVINLFSEVLHDS